MGKLTTHVLDTHSGLPARGVVVEVWREGDLLCRSVTNADGRCDGPLLEGEAFSTGAYELVFAVGDYFRERGVACPFLDRVPVWFGVDGAASYHVPLVCSPWAYSTYRGS